MTNKGDVLVKILRLQQECHSDCQTLVEVFIVNISLRYKIIFRY